VRREDTGRELGAVKEAVDTGREVTDGLEAHIGDTGGVRPLSQSL
jgi:hypothetical protein